jgi:ADP-ribosylation factor 2-binding protein
MFGEDEFEIAAQGQNESDDKFDMYVGALQDVLLDDEFEKMTK